MVENVPEYVRFLFEMTRRDHRFSQLIKNVPLTSLRPLIKLIREVQPTIIVSTFRRLARRYPA